MKLLAICLFGLLSSLCSATTNLPIYNVPVIGISDPDPGFGCIKKSKQFSHWYQPPVISNHELCPAITCTLIDWCATMTMEPFWSTPSVVQAKYDYQGAISMAAYEYNTANDAAWNAYIACLDQCMQYGPPSMQCTNACCSVYNQAEQAAASAASQKINQALKDYQNEIYRLADFFKICNWLDDCCQS